MIVLHLPSATLWTEVAFANPNFQVSTLIVVERSSASRGCARTAASVTRRLGIARAHLDL